MAMKSIAQQIAELQAKTKGINEHIKETQGIERTIRTQLDKLARTHAEAKEQTGESDMWLRVNGIPDPASLLRTLLKTYSAAGPAKTGEETATAVTTTESTDPSDPDGETTEPVQSPPATPPDGNGWEEPRY